MAASLEHVLAQLQRWASPRLEELPDAVLLERFVAQRDESAFAALLARHGSMVWHSCCRILSDAHETEDAFQATFLILARKAHTLRQAAALPGFLHSVARHVALKARTKAAGCVRYTPLVEKLSDTRSDPLMQLTARELLTVLDEEIARLPAAQRSAIVLCCLEGHSREEAAKMLGCTPGSLKGHLERGRQRLQKRLEHRGIALSAALALVMVAREGIAARVPALLLQSTVRAALHGCTGGAASALAHSVLQAMFLPKFAGVMAVTLTLALAASTTVALIYRGPAVETPDQKKPAVPTASTEAGAGKSRPRTDAQGDPLPAGAIARLGSQHFRHTNVITRLAFAPDGKRLVSQGQDGVRFWDTATGKEVRHIAPQAGRIWAASDLSADGKWLAGKNIIPGSVVRTSPIELWGTESGKKIREIGEGFCHEARFSPDGKLLAISDTIRKITLWDLNSKQKLRSWEAHPMQVWTFAFSADSRKLVTSGTTGEIRLWDVVTGRQLQEFKPLDWKPGFVSTPNSTALTPDGRLLALIEANVKSSSAAGKPEWKARISLRDTETGKQVHLLTCATKEIVPGYASPFRSLLFRRDGKRFFTGGPDEFLREWDVATGKELRRIAIPPGNPAMLALSPDEKQLAAVMVGNMSIRLVDLVHGKSRDESPGHWAAVTLATLTPDGRTAVTANFEGSALIWDVAKGTVRRRFDDHKQAILSLQLLPDGRTAFSSSYDGNLRIWDIETGKQHREIKLDRELLITGFNGLTVSRDGKMVAFLDRNKTIRVLDADTRTERQHFRAPESLHGLALPADCRSLVGWSGDRRVHVWDLATGAKRHEYPLPRDPESNGPVPVGGNSQGFYHPALSPDGRLFAMSTQGRMIIKDLTTSHDVHRIHNPPSNADILTFSPDGRTLAYGTSDATIHFLEVASGRERGRLVGHRGQVKTLRFSARGDRLISGCADTTALIWDLGLHPHPGPATPEELRSFWADLANPDAKRAYRALRTLAALPSSSIPFVRELLSPVATVDKKHLTGLVGALDSDDFTKRERASAELQKLGERALPAYRLALEGKPSLEARRRLEELLAKAHQAWWDISGERLRSLRAIEAMELSGTPEARDVLQTLAAGAEGARLTEEAKAALKRLQR